MSRHTYQEKTHSQKISINQNRLINNIDYGIRKDVTTNSKNMVHMSDVERIQIDFFLKDPMELAEI